MEKKNVHDLQFKNTTPLSEGGAKKNDARLSWWRSYVQELYQVLLSFDEPPRQNCRYASGANLILPIQTSLGRNPHSTLLLELFLVYGSRPLLLLGDPVQKPNAKPKSIR